MSKKTSTDMLIEGGILPENGVAQLERHRMVPQGTTEKLGSHPVSFDRDSGEASRFADRLQQKLDDEESEIRQQDLAVAGERRAVHLQWGDGSLDPNPQKVLVDKLGRVYLPLHMLGNGQRRKIKGISFTGSKADAIPVQYTEPRYEGDLLKHLVCTLRRRS